MTTMTAKKGARDIIKELEGWSETVYKDSAGIPTIGWGHKILPGEDFTYGITKAEGEILLSKDIQFAENAVNYYVVVPLKQSMYDALVSFVFNVGAQAFINSTLLKKLNVGDYEGAAAEFARWKYVTINGEKVVSSGLVNRRAKESALFSQGLA